MIKHERSLLIKIALAILIFLFGASLFAVEKYALVIGNGDYKTVPKLANAVNDASDVKTTLEGLGFNVDLLINADLAEMEDASINFKEKLSQNSDSYGFFFYAGHGVQSGGQNYLIPVDANVRSESFLKTKAFNVQSLLYELEAAKNKLNVIVLDACRDNPFGWSRGSLRGLAVVGEQPAGSIVVYATSAGKTAADGAGRNGLFTSQLLKNLPAENVEIKEIFTRTGADVLSASGGYQYPELSIKFFGRAYLNGEEPAALPVNPSKPSPLSGLWNGTVTYTKDGERYRDFYEINFLNDGTCDIQILVRQDDYAVYQFGQGYWSIQGNTFRLDSDFFNPVVERLESIRWESPLTFENGKRRLKLKIKPDPNYAGTVSLVLNKSSTPLTQLGAF